MAPRKNYTPDQLKNAVEAVKNGEKIAVAAKRFGVPMITLHDKISGKTTMGCSMGPSTVLTKGEEEILEKWILALYERHIPLTKDSLLDSVQKIIIDQNRPNPFTNNRPSKKWFQSFMKRHPNLTQRVTDNLSRARDNVSEHNIRTWFTEIESYLDENNFKTILNDPHRIFNADETAFFLSPKPGRVLAKKGDKHPYSGCGDEKDNLTVLITGNAAGDLAPPMIIFNYERIPSTIAVSVPDEWAIGKSESGWMCSSTFYEYMTNVFNPWLEQNNIEKPVLFFVDGHKSHLTLHLSNFCSENGIVLVALYPNSTHILQPMDLSVFRPLKAHWKKAVTQWKMENLGKILRKENFAPVLQKALTNVTKNCVQNGFRAAGLFPFGPDYIDMSKISKTEIETTTKTNPMQKEFMKYLEREIVNVFSAQKLQQFNKLYFENRNTLEREIPDEDEALYLIWAKNKSEDALCHSSSADAPTTSDTLEQARNQPNDVTTAQTNDVLVTDEPMVIPSDAGDAVPTETEEMHFDSMQTVNQAKDGNSNDLIETDSSAQNSKKIVDDNIGVTHSLPVAKTVTTDDETILSESISSTNLPKVIVEYLPQQLNYNVRHDAVTQPLPPPERSLPTDLSKDPLMQQPNNVPKTDTVNNQPVLIPELTSPIGSAEVTGDPQRQKPNNVPKTDTVTNQPVLIPELTSPIGSAEVTGDPQRQQPNHVPKTDTVTNQPVLIPELTSPIGSAEVTGDPQSQQPNNVPKTDTVTNQPVLIPELTSPIGSAKVTGDPQRQQPNNVPKPDTVTNQPVLIPELTSPIGSAEVTGDPQRQQPDNNSTVNTLFDQALPPPNPSSSSSFPEVIGSNLFQQPIISTMEPQYTTPQKSLEKVLGVIVPSPFKRSLFWPENSMDSNKKRMKREKIPSTVTSKAWKEYHEKKVTEKNKKQQEKDERARQRIEKKKLKEQLTNEKKNKSKIKKTKKTVQEDSTSEESDVEISYAESDISYNLEDDEEKEPEREIITKTKNQIDCDSIDSDLENLPLSKIASSKAIKSNKNRKFSIGNFVIIKYEGEYFPGKIESLTKNEYEISTMTLTTGNTFKWPNPPDKIFYKLKEIMEVIKEPICLNKRGFYRIPEMDKYLPNMYSF